MNINKILAFFNRLSHTKIGGKSASREYRNVQRPLHTPAFLKSLKADEVFVFFRFSRVVLDGDAVNALKLPYGETATQYVGMQGQSYSIPIIGYSVGSNWPYVNEFIDYARQHPDTFFYVSMAGIGSNQLDRNLVAQLFVNAVHLPNVCLPKLFVRHIAAYPAIKAPKSYRLAKYGQCRTLADVVKTLNTQHHYGRYKDLKNDLEQVIKDYKRRKGFDVEAANLVVNTLEAHAEKLFRDGKFNVEQFDKLLDNHFIADKFASIDRLYTRRMCAKLVDIVQLLNDICRYNNIKDLQHDLSLVMNGEEGNQPANLSDDYGGPDPTPTKSFVGCLLNLWPKLTVEGVLNNDLLEQVMFTNHQEELAQKGIRAVIEESFRDDDRCSFGIYRPIARGTAPIYIEDNMARTYRKSCLDSSSLAFNQKFEFYAVRPILDKKIEEGEYQILSKRYYVPMKDFDRPVFDKYVGRLSFPSMIEKTEFINRNRAYNRNGNLW